LTRILSVDYGDKRVGIAISDILKIIAKPYDTIENKSDKFVIDKILEMANDKNVEKIIVGLPLTMKGEYSIQTDKVLDFINLLKKNTSISIEKYDERLSSLEAKKSLIKQGIKTGHNKSEVDKTAAAIFLQSYLNKNDNF
tara:strand:- start:1210 stop:1629 length:420 start_codon:yes stop_codon:yes gene_type:complete